MGKIDTPSNIRRAANSQLPRSLEELSATIHGLLESSLPDARAAQELFMRAGNAPFILLLQAFFSAAREWQSDRVRDLKRKLRIVESDLAEAEADLEPTAVPRRGG